MATIVCSLWLAAELARISRNEGALLARCPRHIQSVLYLIEDILFWSIDSCQLRYPLTSVTKLYRGFKCRTHLICRPVIGFTWIQHCLNYLRCSISIALKGHIMNNFILTSSIRSLQGNLRPRPWPRSRSVNTCTWRPRSEISLLWPHSRLISGYIMS